MADSLLSLPEVREIFESGMPELSGYYLDKGDQTFMDGSQFGSGMLCKYRPDWRTDWCLADVKSSRDITAHAFSSTINALNYHVSAAHYLAGDRQLTNTDHEQFIFLCVEPEPPYLACVYVLDQESLSLGYEIRRASLNGIKHGRDTDEWPRINGGVAQSIGVPQYAFYNSPNKKL